MLPAVPRSFLGAALDRTYGWLKGLPAETCTYSMQPVQIPIDDKTHVGADLYRPINHKISGTVLVRSPYGIGFPSSLNLARIWAARGYQVLISNCRGTFDSGGEFEPARNEAADGHASVVWMRQQEWYTGSFATLGGSYLGYNQWALLSNPPEDMKAAIITTGPYSFAHFIWDTGALSANIIAWADIQTRMKSGLLSIIRALRSQKTRLQPVLDAVPLSSAVDAHFDGQSPAWLKRCLSCSDPNDASFAAMRQTEALEKADIPILLTAGWNDVILPDVLLEYETLNRRGHKVALTIGPWTHLSCQSDTVTLNETWQWLNTHLSDGDAPVRLAPVHVFVTGADEWRDMEKWPPTTTPLTLFLGLEQKLSEQKLDRGSSLSFIFDPKSPTPSMAHPLLFDNGPGRSESDNSLATRTDTLYFETEPMKNPVEVCGRPRVMLTHSTDAPHADVLVVLSDVDPKGVSQTITEKYLRLDPDRDTTKPLELDLIDCAHRFRSGHKIRVLIAGGSHPRYIRNLGTGEDPVRGTAMRTVVHTIQLDAASFALPVVSGTGKA